MSRFHHPHKSTMNSGPKGGGKKKFIASAIKRPGALHKDLGVPPGKKIPAAKLNAATHSKNPKIRERADFAKTLESF